MADGNVEIIDERPIRLDLACGQTPREGFTGVDLFAGDVRVDLLRFPWPWADGSVSEVHCSHFVEHIPMAYIDGANQLHLGPADGRRDLFLAFFAEVHRILKPGGKATIIVPYLRHERAFQDPTHRRFLCEASFLYLSKGWREANKLDHYIDGCDFRVNVTRVVDQMESVRHAEVVGQRLAHMWNVCLDINVELVKL